MSSILIIEDVPAVLLSMRIILQGRGHKVIAVSNGADGLAALRAEAVDLVITDIWMPGMTGAEVIRQGRAIAPGTRFLAITGGDPNGADPKSTMRDMRVEADDVLLKPFEKPAMLAVIDRLLSKTLPVA